MGASKTKKHLPAGGVGGALWNRSVDLLATASLDGYLTAVSPSWQRVLGYTPQELTAEPYLNFVHPDDRQETITEAQQCLEPKHVTAYFENRYLAKDGSYRTLEWSIWRSDDESELHCIARDITARKQASERAVADAEYRYRLVAENTEGAVLLITPEGKLTWVSPSIEKLLGYPAAEWMNKRGGWIIHPDDLAEANAVLARGAGSAELRFRHANGEYRWMSAGRKWVKDDRGNVVGRVDTLRDIHEQVLARHALIDSERHYRLLAENASDVIWQTDPGGLIIWASESITSVLGWRQDQIIGTTGVDLLHPQIGEDNLLARPQTTVGERVSGECQVLCANGSYRMMEINLRSVTTDGGICVVAALRDIQKEVDTREQLMHAIEHDPLTGLSTRPMLAAYLEHRIASAGERYVGVLCIGIDALKSVNEALTHSGGDSVISAVADRLRVVATDASLLARGSGDEFWMVVSELDRAADAAVAAERARQAAKGTITLGGYRLRPTVSIGIATGGVDASSADLLRDASLAMRQAKDRGRDRFEFASAQLAEEARHRLIMEDRIRGGLRAGQFVPWFQPIVNLSDQAVIGYEALVRWVRPDGTITPPDEFLPTAERSTLIAEIDLVVLRRSVAVLAELPDDIHMSVNVSAATFIADYADDVTACLASFDVSPSRLHLEITETALLDATEPIRRAMAALSTAGVRWYVDDFGTGYSSITHLRDLPIAGLKLDMSFTAGIGDGDLTCERLAKALAGMADGLELDTVAEGIETSGEAAVLRAQGWKHGQGWLYGRPTPIDPRTLPGRN
ncbi:MAG: EAL domain-containing protein [Actinomycetes bacterium]